MARTIYIAIGGNLPSAVGFPHQTLLAVRGNIARAGGVVVAASALYRTAPMGEGVGGFFINGVLGVRIFCSPDTFFTRLEGIERLYRKSRTTLLTPHAAASHAAAPLVAPQDRSLDLDMLLAPTYSGEACWVCLPHPRMDKRRFVLVPLRDIYPHYLVRSLTFLGGGAVFPLHARRK